MGCVPVHMRYIIIMNSREMVIGFEGTVFYPIRTAIMVINILHSLFKILTVQQID